MSNPRATLNRHVTWLPLLKMLGATVKSRALPTRLLCPVCEKEMLEMHEDHACGGQWYHCHGCRAGGDLIELAANVWNIGVADAIARLTREGFDLPSDHHDVSHYLEQHVNYRRRLLQNWRDAEDRLATPGPTAARLLSQLNLRSDLSPERLRKGPARLVGAADCDAIERAFAPQSMDHADSQRQKNNPSAHRIFKGEAWDDVLVIPFYDVPWRIKAFLLIGRAGDRKKDMVFKLANIVAPGNQHSGPAELGLATDPGIRAAAEAWEHTVFALEDPILALQLQVRHYRESLQPLPIVAWHDTRCSSLATSNGRPARTAHAWQMVQDQRIVFWMPKLRPSVIQQAIDVDGLISRVGPRRTSHSGKQSLKEYCSKYPPRDLLRHIGKTARPWPEVLAGVLDGMTDGEVEIFAARLEALGVRLDDLARRGGRRVQRRLDDLQESVAGGRCIQLDGFTITERNNKWFVRGGKYRQEEVIVEAVLRLDLAVYQRGQLFYRGTILFGDEVVPFFAPAKEIEPSPLRWMRGKLMAAGKGFLWFNPAWEERAFTIATYFQTTKIWQAPDALGWDPRNNCFVLPGYMIELGGSVVPLEASLFPELDTAQRVAQPEAPSPQELQHPSASNPDTGHLFWATAAAVLSNLIAPAFGERPRAVALVGEGAVAIGEAVAAAMGSLMHPIRDAQEAREAVDVESTHRWPVVFQVVTRLQRRHQQMLLEAESPHGRHAVMRVDWYQGMTFALTGSWHVVAGETGGKVAPQLREVASKLLPAYLQDLCERGLGMDLWPERADSFLEDVLEDLARFVDQQYGNGEDVLAALKVLWPGDDDGHAAALGELLVRFIQAGDLDVVDETAGTRPALLRVPEDEGLLLPHATWHRLLRRRQVPLPDAARVGAALAQAGVLIENRDEGWVISEAWLRERLGTVATPLAVSQ